MYTCSLVAVALAIRLLGFSDPNSMLGYSLKMTINSSSIMHTSVMECYSVTKRNTLWLHPFKQAKT